MGPCAIESCNNASIARSWCSKHYQRWSRSGSPTGQRAERQAGVNLKRDVPEYGNWRAMKRRCDSPNQPRFEHYGGRGITVCERWLHSFTNFYADMGPKPTAKHTLNRIDNDGNYEPGNVEWATYKEQANNTSRSKRSSVAD